MHGDGTMRCCECMFWYGETAAKMRYGECALRIVQDDKSYGCENTNSTCARIVPVYLCKIGLPRDRFDSIRFDSYSIVGLSERTGESMMTRDAGGRVATSALCRTLMPAVALCEAR